MNALEELLSRGEAEKRRLGIEATPAEIAQQPQMWRDTARRVAATAPQLRALCAAVGLPGSAAETIFAGAGTSDFVGRCVQGPVSAALRTRALAVPTTDIVTHPQYAFPADRPGLMVSFARSGNSPESVAALDIVLRERPQVRHLVITCNEAGELAARARDLGDRAFALVLDPRTNDRGLAMTSSFTSMVIAGLGLAYLDRVEEYSALVERAAAAAARVLETAPDVAKALVEQCPARACFLGSGALTGAAVECHLKLQELTDGGIICLFGSFLGIRHGPRAAIHDDTLVVYFVSSDPDVRRYELDLIRGNREQGIGLAHLIAYCSPDQEELLFPSDSSTPCPPAVSRVRLLDSSIPDAFLAPVFTIVGQLLGLFASLARGLKPDAPSAGGVIHRVVQGVTIHPRRGTQQ